MFSFPECKLPLHLTSFNIIGGGGGVEVVGGVGDEQLFLLPQLPVFISGIRNEKLWTGVRG